MKKFNMNRKRNMKKYGRSIAITLVINWKIQSKGNNQKVYLEEELNLENLFEESNIMATQAEVNRALERALGLTVNELNNLLAAGRSILKRIEATNDRVNI